MPEMPFMVGHESGTPNASVAGLVALDRLVAVVSLPAGYGLLPITLSIAQVGSWTGLKKTKVQELINCGAILTSKVDARTLVITSSVIALVERNRVVRGR